MWSRDGHIYFVSDREGGGLTNLWRVPEKGGKAERITAFTSDDLRWPSIGTDSKTIVFEHDFAVWKLDPATRKAAPIKFEIAAETQENSTEIRSFSSQADDYDLAPNGRRKRILIATKCGLERHNNEIRRNASPSRIREEVTESLKRLRTSGAFSALAPRKGPPAPL